MADTKVSAETAATALTGAELLRTVQGGSSKKTTAALLGHQFRGARVRMTADDTTVNATGAGYVVPFDAALFDTDSFWSAGSPTRLTIPTGLGIDYVELTGQVLVTASGADTWFGVSIEHYNSSAVLQDIFGFRNLEGGSTGRCAMASSGPVAVADGDYFTLTIREESDTSITVEGDTTPRTFLAITVVGMTP